MANLGWDKLGAKPEPANEGATFEERFPDYANPLPATGIKETAPGSDTYVEKKITPADPGRPVNEYENMPWSEVGSKALENAWPSAKGVVTDTASAIYNYDKTLPALAHTAAGLGRKAYRAVTGDESGANDPMAKEDMVAADALIGDYKDKYGSMSGFKKRLAEDPFNIGMDAASVVAPAAKVPGVTSKVARAAELALDPVQATVAAGKKVASVGAKKSAALGEYVQRAWLGVHSGHPRAAYQIMQDAGKMPGPDGTRARDTVNRFMRGEGTPEDIANAASDAFEEVKRKASDSYKAGIADITKFKQPLPFNRIAPAAKDLADYVNAGHPNPHDALMAQEAIQIVQDRFADPSMRTIEGLDRMKRDIRERASTVKDAKLKHHIYELANSAKATIMDADPRYGAEMEKWQAWIDQANDLKSQLGAGNQRLSESAFIKKLQDSLKSDRKGQLVQELSQTQAGRDLPYMIAGENLKGLLPDWWFGNLAAVAPGALHMLANPTLALGAIPSAVATSPKIGGHIAKWTGSGRRVAGSLTDKAGAIVDKANNSLVTQPLYQEGREERLGRRSGGRVGTVPHEAIADQLVAQADRAKKFLGKTTEALLDTPDEMVAKALAVASKGL